jgi:hypothetical protein
MASRISTQKLLSLLFLLIAVFVVFVFTRRAGAQTPSERSFPQAKPTVEKKLKGLQSAIAGRLPILDGFTVPDNRPLDHFKKGYYQCTVEVHPTPAGGSRVRISTKITAWYTDPSGSKSGYQVLPSNGRLENDLLDQLSDVLGASPGVSSPTTGANSPEAPSQTGSNSREPSRPLISAPVPQLPQDPLAGSAVPNQVDQNQPASLRQQTEATEKRERELAKEARSLEEILNNQAHPSNLAAVKKSGTPVVANPSADGKILFAATLGDEFEILDEAPQWVHVRISGLSRGWIRRSSLEMPGEAAQAAGGSNHESSAAFQVGSEQFGAFPGDWAPLRGKTVKIVSVQKARENASNIGPREKMEFAKALFISEYDKVSSTAEGIVLIFDSEDGGMVAATVAVLQQWREGKLSDEAFWHQCFFDPPEILNPVSTARE